jgi:DNA polymerase III epsilon subunit-like protein
MTTQDQNAKLLAENVIAIDIETENTGADIDQDNKRILSVQIGNATNVELYYADSKHPAYGLPSARDRIAEMLSNGYVLTGYNIERFDIPHIAKFLGIPIPPSNSLDLTRTDVIRSLKRSHELYKLEDICSWYSIPVKHKHRMNEKAETYRTRQDILALADREAPKIARKKGGTVEYAREEAIRKIAGGSAILDSYKEFVEKEGSKDTLFYEYATEDIICEHRLFEVVKQRQAQKP